MGSSFTKSMEPEELAAFKKVPTDFLLPNTEIPERAENRKSTDKPYLIAFGVLVVLLMPFLIYTLVNSDLDRIYGYDPCGNICGKENSKYDSWSCTGKDLTDKKYLQFEENIIGKDEAERLVTPRKCVHHCKQEDISLLWSCLPRQHHYEYNDRFSSSNDHFSDTDNPSENNNNHVFGVSETYIELQKYLRKFAWRITLACFLSLGVGLGTLYLFRTATAAMVWSILAGVLVLGSILVGISWHFYIQWDQDSGKEGLLVASIFLTALLLVLFCVMVFLFKKIQLVIVLLKESVKALFAMPQLLFIPILTFIAEVIILALFVTTSIYMSTSANLTEIKEGYLAYEKNIVMVFSMFFNLFVTIWASQFVIGIQYMVIAGAVSKWYFAKNKDYLDGPIITSTSTTFKYHLGSVAFGSLVITVVAIIRATISSLMRNGGVKACMEFCMSNIEQFLKFLSKNSYILTAMHGKPFFKSGKRAAKIIFQNALNVASINFIGDFILGMAQLMVIFISLLFTYAIMQDEDSPYCSVVYAIVFVVSLTVAAIFFAIFETIIDTIFLCFCEDSLLNDGMVRPYAMSRDLMEFMDNAKKLFPEKKK